MSPDRDQTILSIGEIVWDLFPEGPLLGGAPLNFAAQARALGANAQMISRVGQDPLGARVLEVFAGLQLDAGTVQRDAVHETGVVTVTVSTTGEPSYRIAPDSAWDHIEETPSLLEAAKRADGIYFGSLAQRSDLSRRTIQRLVAATPAGAIRVFDVNLRAPFFSEEIIRKSLELANVAKVNEAELMALGEMFGFGGNSLEKRAEALARKFNLSLVACTMGESGSFLWTARGSIRRAGMPTTVVDTVGAGDAFAASLITGLLIGLPLEEIATHANEFAAYVCSQPGATPAIPERLKRGGAVASESKPKSADFELLSHLSPPRAMA